MIWTLKNFKTTDYFTKDSTLYALNPNGKLYDFTISKFSEFDAPQRAAVISFLEFMASQDQFVDAGAAQEALDNYWLKKS